MVGMKIPGVVYMPAADIQYYKDKGVFTDQTLIGAFRETFARGGDRIALSGPRELTTFAELDAVTDRGAAALWRLGLRPTDRVLFQMRNCKELVYAFFSCLKIGVIPVCTLAAHREQEIGYIGRHTEAKAHFVHGDDSRFDMVEFARTIAPRIPSMAHTLVVRGAGNRAGALSFESLIAAEDARRRARARRQHRARSLSGRRVPAVGRNERNSEDHPPLQQRIPLRDAVGDRADGDFRTPASRSRRTPSCTTPR